MYEFFDTSYLKCSNNFAVDCSSTFIKVWNSILMNVISHATFDFPRTLRLLDLIPVDFWFCGYIISGAYMFNAQNVWFKRLYRAWDSKHRMMCRFLRVYCMYLSYLDFVISNTYLDFRNWITVIKINKIVHFLFGEKKLKI